MAVYLLENLQTKEMEMKKPSGFVMALLDQFLVGQPALGEQLKAKYQSYYGFTAAKGLFAPGSGPFLTPKLLSADLSVSLKTLERWRLTGGGPPFIKVSKQVRYPVVELDNWVRHHLMNQE